MISRLSRATGVSDCEFNKIEISLDGPLHLNWRGSEKLEQIQTDVAPSSNLKNVNNKLPLHVDGLGDG